MDFHSPTTKKILMLTQAILAIAIIGCGMPVLLNLPSALPDIEFFSPWTSMRFNSALCMALFGASLLCLAFNKKTGARAVGGILVLVGGATFSQYLFKIDLGIDELFRSAHGSLINGHPGRMALGSAASYTLSGMALVLLSKSKAQEKFSIVTSLLSVIPSGLGLITLLSYAFDTTVALNSGILSHMAFPTASGFLLGGALLTFHALKPILETPSESYQLGPFFYGLVLFLGFLFVWQFLINEEQKYFHNLVSMRAVSVKDELLSKLDETSLALQRLASRTTYLGSKDKDFLAMDAHAYLNHIKILNRIGLIDKDFKVIWSFPKDLSWQVKDFNQSIDSNRKSAIETSMKTNGPTLSRTIELRSGGKGFLLPVPLHHKKDPAKFLYATIKADKLFQSLTNADENYQMAIYEGGKQIFQSTKFKNAKNELAKISVLNWNSSSWEIVVAPSEAFVFRTRSAAPYIVLFGGGIISLLVACFLQFVSIARKREQKHAEEQKILTNQLNIALSSSQMAVWAFDLQTGQTWRSENHDRIFGYRTFLDEWTDEIFSTHLVDEKDKELVKQFVAEARSINKPTRIDLKIRRANDQAIRWIMLIGQLQIDSSTQAEKLIGIVRDITEEKLAENQRFIDSEWIKVILNSTSHSIIAIDEQGTIQTFNTAAEKMLGYSKSEVVGICNPGIFHDFQEMTKRAEILSVELGEKVEPGLECFFAKARKLNTVDINEWTYIRKDGSRLPVSLSATALKDLDGKIVGYLGVAVDLTEYKKNEEQLKIAHERLGRVIEATEEGIWERDFLTKEITFIDDQARKAFGLNSGEMPIYDEILSRIHPDDRSGLAVAVERHVTEKSPRFNHVFRLQSRESKRWTWIRARGKVETLENSHKRLVSTISDVTAEVESRNQLEDALRAASDAALVKSAFLASMSHEIRTPLNGIIGMTDLLLETSLSEDQKRFADIVQNSGVGLLDLINDILDFSKIESGKLHLEDSNFSLAGLVENQTDLMMAKARKKKIALITYLSPDLPQNFQGDAGRIGQVLLNLIGNAVKFTQSGGVNIRVTPAFVLKSSVDKFKVRFEIEDSGIGIAKESQSKLFQPFSQADNKISRKFGGTGLGLSISKQLIEAMGGEIGVISTAGKGSTFWFEIPLTVNGRANFFEKHTNIKELAKARILVVDNDQMSIDVIQRYISSWKMRDASVANFSEVKGMVTEAIENNDPFDVALIGVQSESDETLLIGGELLLEHGKKSPKLLAITEFDFNFTDEEASRYGFFETLKKPLKQSPLFDAIARSWSGEKRAVAPDNFCLLPLVHKNKRILIADDVKTNRLLATSLLEKLGHTAHAVGSGKEAIEALEQMHFDLILMDCLMPEMDGIEATKIIRSQLDATKRNIPIVALTANVSTLDKEACTTAGMNAFLTKPLFKDDLQMTLEKLFSVEEKTEQKTKLLLVDDHDENRTLILHYLKNLPYDIEIAVDGLDAFNKFKTGNFQIVLMDMQMPIMDGYEATKTIRDWENSFSRERAVIIALTANALKEECDKAFKMGCDAHLTKPIRKQKLVDFLQQVVNDKHKLKASA
jgi:PAS domain S-box-containing protein